MNLKNNTKKLTSDNCSRNISKKKIVLCVSFGEGGMLSHLKGIQG